MQPHRFRIGRLECAIVSDGTFSYPHPAHLLFVNAPQDELAPALAASGIQLPQWDAYESPYPGLLIDTGREKVLLDTGAGDFGPSTGRLVSNLRKLGVDTTDIDVVVLTHAHPDHVGGALDSDGQPAFPNARHVISQAEWDFWRSGPDLSPLTLPDEFKDALLAYASRTLPALADQIETIDPGTEILPGVTAIDASGHTPGQLALRVASENDVLLAVADVVVHPLHLQRPEWCTAVDYDRETTVATRQRILRQAATEDALLFAYHFPAPGLGRVRPNGDTWQWEPVATS